MTTSVTLDKFNIVADDDMKLALFNFFNQLEFTVAMEQYFNRYISFFKDIKLSDVTRLTFCDIWNSNDFHSSYFKVVYTNINLSFLVFLLKNNLYKGNDIDDLTPFIKVLESTGRPTDVSKLFLDKDKSPNQLFVFSFRYDGPDVNREISLKLIDTNCTNKFIVSLLSDFYNSKNLRNFTNNSLFEFAISFVCSYKDIKNFKNILDFNYSVFEKQFEYYKDNTKLLKLLIWFYQYLHEVSKHEGIFKSKDPIDIVMLLRGDFIDLYKSGFKLVNFNPYENVPSLDKWLIKPNGFENASTRLTHNTYQKIDFTEVDNEIYRNSLKHFFWEDDTNLVSRRGDVYRVKDFLNFLTIYKTNFMSNADKDIDYKTITTIDIFSYRSDIETKGLKTSTKNGIYRLVRKFLNYCIDKKYLNVETGAFEFLQTHTGIVPTGGTAISDTELEQIERYLRECSEESLAKNLYYIIFHLAVETEFRISQILSLKKSDIKEGMKENQFYIHSTTKVSNKDKEFQHITAYAKQHLDIAINHTEKLRAEARDEDKDYIFLFKYRGSSESIIRTITAITFTKHLKTACRKIGIKEYTASNLRDTHMTKALEYSFKKELTKLQTGILTNHKNMQTTTDNYYSPDIRAFAEATYGIIIGDVDIKGNILPEYNDKFTKADTVDKECGFCEEDKCKIQSELGCPMCDGFVVTLDRIPYFEQRLKEFDNEISNESIVHERQHLLSRKRLYLAYLERLYNLRENLSR